MLTYVLLGSNLGDKKSWLLNATTMIAKECGPILNKSSVWQSKSWGYDSQHHYLNQAVMIDWMGDPEILMNLLLKIEAALGRTRSAEIGYADRVIDLDILAIENQVIQGELVTLPHPRLHQRAFALLPLLELAPTWQHPVLHLTVEQLLDQVDKTEVIPWQDVHSC
jgi:2-amino-4-hydroxy-6-hydroxymethyldihydropteridine diphosphokinase